MYAGVGGLVALIIMIMTLAYSGMGSWAWQRVQMLDEKCYQLLNQRAGSISGPVCGAVAQGVLLLEQTGNYIEHEYGYLRQRVMGGTDIEQLASQLGDIRLGSIASPKQALDRLLEQGPKQLDELSMDNLSRSFQQSVDSFAISQRLMADRATASQAVPWLEYGASQPMGYGVMSQLKLGDLYLKGAPGVPADPQRAQYYLGQAGQSIGILQGANTAQSKALLGALGGDPQVMRMQVERVVQELQKGMPR